MARKIMISNQKGGVGKTTITFELSAMYSRMGYRVLALDLDGQRNFSLYSKVQLKDIPTIRDVLFYLKELSVNPDFEIDDSILDKAIQKTEEGYDMIASEKKLSESQADFGKPEDVYLLQDLLSVLEDEYDYIFIDCAPARSPLLYMSYFVCDYCLIVTEADLGSLDGIEQVSTDIRLLKQRKMTDCKMLGILLNKNENTSEQNKIYIKLCNIGQEIGVMPFKTTIFKGIAVTEAKNNCMSVIRYMEQGDSSIKKKAIEIVEQFKGLISEIEERIEVYEQ